MSPLVQAFHDAVTGTVSYVVYERPDAPCAVIDPVLDFDARSGRTSTASAERVVAFLGEHRLQLEWILETHAHADHLSAADWLRDLLGGRVAAGRKITEVQAVFKELFHLEDGFATDGSQFDKLFTDGETFMIGGLTGKAITVPGHTPACVAYQVGETVFVGDTLFMPDLGTARCDFPGGSAAQLHRSVRRLLQLPPATRLFVCHDDPPPEREARWESTVAEQRAHNIHVHDGVTEEEFVALRNARDVTLEMPQLMLAAVQVNIRAGQLPPPEANGVAYLKIPLNLI